MPRVYIRGFTLVELMVTIAIVAILAAIAFPNFESTMRSNRVATSTNELIASINLARSEALRSPGGAVVCASQNGTACDGSWSQGWIVFSDLNASGAIDGDDRIVRYSQAPNKISVSAALPTGGAAVNRLTFDRRGRLQQAPVLTLKPTTCPETANLQRRITLSLSGQVTSSRLGCNE